MIYPTTFVFKKPLPNNNNNDNDNDKHKLIC
jgi:hypothetical protein